MRRLAAALTLSTLAACSQGGEAGSSGSESELGRRVYRNICTACHNADPTRDGSLGPAVAGSSRELLEGMIVTGEYPPGYTPKRPTQAMPRYPHLEPHLDALAVYLAEAAAGSGSGS